MSVALLDHGEIVPGRGTTKIFRAPVPSGARFSPDNSKPFRRSVCSVDSEPGTAMK